MVFPDLLLWFTLLPSGLEQLLVQTVLGYQSVMEAFGRISSSTCPSPRYSHLEIWTLPSPSYLSVLRCLGVAFGVRCIRDACLVQQWIHVLREAFGELHIFSTCGALRPVAFLSISQNGEVCTVNASSCSVSSRGSHFESGHYLYELSM